MFIQVNLTFLLNLVQIAAPFLFVSLCSPDDFLLSMYKGEIQEFKQINSLHASHVLALSQICPNDAGDALTYVT
jgi:hypothetical protein